MKLLSFVLGVALLVACQSQPSDTAEKTRPAPSREGPAKLIYSWVDDRGKIHMADHIEDVPLAIRPRVVVTDTGRSRSQRLASDEVLVVDLRARGEFSPVDLTRPRHVDLTAPPAVRSSSGVVLYSAPWCGFCKKAAAHLRARGVDFVERNIEADPSAARDLREKLRKAKIAGAGIPVLDIRGTLVVGFDQQRIDALLPKGK